MGDLAEYFVWVHVVNQELCRVDFAVALGHLWQYSTAGRNRVGVDCNYAKVVLTLTAADIKADHTPCVV